MSETKRTVDENGVVHFSKDDSSPTVHVQVENQTEISKDELWNEMKRGISEQYEKRGITFDVNTIQNKEDLDNAAQVLNDIKNKEKLEAKMNKSAPSGGDTAMLNYNQLHGTTYQLDRDSDLPLDMCEFDNEQSMINELNRRAKNNDESAKKALSQLTNKQFKGSKLLDVEFQGSSKDFLRNEKKINEFDSDELKAKKEAFNERLRRNRTNWSNISDYQVKIMTETKQIKKPKTDKYTKISKNGRFIESKDGFFWEQKTIIKKWDKTFRNWAIDSEETKLLDVIDSPLHLKKSVIAHIIFMREDENKNKWNNIEKSYFYLKLKYDIKDADNLFFAEVDGKIMLKDLHYGVTCPIALNESNLNYKCVQLGNIEKISPEKASEIVKETGTRLIFGKVEQDASGQIKSFGTGV